MLAPFGVGRPTQPPPATNRPVPPDIRREFHSARGQTDRSGGIRARRRAARLQAERVAPALQAQDAFQPPRDTSRRLSRCTRSSRRAQCIGCEYTPRPHIRLGFVALNIFRPAGVVDRVEHLEQAAGRSPSPARRTPAPATARRGCMAAHSRRRAGCSPNIAGLGWHGRKAASKATSWASSRTSRCRRTPGPSGHARPGPRPRSLPTMGNRVNLTFLF